MDRWDAVALVGLGMVGVGLWFVDWRLALVVVGVALMGLGVMGASNGNSGHGSGRGKE